MRMVRFRHLFPVVALGGCLATACLGNVRVRPIPSFARLDYGLPEKYATVGGVRLCYVDEGKGDEVLVFLHPALSTLKVWRDAIVEFRKRFRVIAMDLPGSGKSDKPPRFRYHPETFADVTARLLDHLGVPAATLVGNSNGGATALAFALRHPGRTRRLVLVAPAGVRAAPPWRQRLLKWVASPLHLGTVNPYLLKVALELAAFPKTGPRTDAYIEDLLALRGARAEYAAWLRAQHRTLLAAVSYDVSARLSSIRVPTLVVWGDKDRTLPHAREHGEILRRGIQGAELVILPGVGHIPEVEVPEAFNRLLDAFLRRTAGTRPPPGPPRPSRPPPRREDDDEEKDE